MVEFREVKNDNPTHRQPARENLSVKVQKTILLADKSPEERVRILNTHQSEGWVVRDRTGDEVILERLGGPTEGKRTLCG